MKDQQSYFERLIFNQFAKQFLIMFFGIVLAPLWACTMAIFSWCVTAYIANFYVFHNDLP